MLTEIKFGVGDKGRGTTLVVSGQKILTMTSLFILLMGEKTGSSMEDNRRKVIIEEHIS
ncbi:hypothetical protein AVEN_117430-1, partial [Araneus ventricosus]